MQILNYGLGVGLQRLTVLFILKVNTSFYANLGNPSAGAIDKKPDLSRMCQPDL